MRLLGGYIALTILCFARESGAKLADPCKPSAVFAVVSTTLQFSSRPPRVGGKPHGKANQPKTQKTRSKPKQGLVWVGGTLGWFQLDPSRRWDAALGLFHTLQRQAKSKSWAGIQGSASEKEGTDLTPHPQKGLLPMFSSSTLKQPLTPTPIPGRLPF